MIRTKQLIASAVALSLLALTPALALAAPAAKASADVTADQTPDGTISLSADDIAAGVGIVWGKGSLTFKGKDYPVTLSGLSVVDVGAAHIDVSGSVYHLKSLTDFPGTYSALSAGATVAGGENAIVLRNQNGVVLKLKGTSEGLRFNLAAEGLKLKFKKAF